MIVVVVASALATAEPAWCADARGRLAVVDAAGGGVAGLDVDAVLAVVPKDVADRARTDIGRAGDRRAARDAVALAVRVGCVDVDVDGDPAAEARAIVTGPGYGGLRTDAEFSEKLQERLWRWLQEFIASDSVQLFAQNTRALYLSSLFVVASFIAARLMLRSRRLARERRAIAELVRVERARERAFAELRAAAERMLVDVDGDVARLRAVLLLLREALLARVGERDSAAKDAVRPQRTSTEIGEHLPSTVAALVVPVLARFDDAYYGGRVDRVVVDAFAGAVDAAAAALSGRGRAP